MRVLITGACGLVGRHMVMHYLSRGHTVHGIDNFVEGGGAKSLDEWTLGDPRDFVDFKMMRGDCRDLFAGGTSHSTRDYDLVLHLAAVVGGRQTIENSPLTVADDLSIDAAMWQWAARARPGRVVYFSSSAAYPVHLQDNPMTSGMLRESDLQIGGAVIGTPDLSYGWAKLTGEYLGMLAEQRAGVSYVVYRPFSGYAEDQGPEYPMRAICERAVRAVANNEPSTHVWGSGQQIRDWVHLDDIVQIVDHTCMTTPAGTTLNLSSGHGTSMTQLMQAAINITGGLLGRDVSRIGITPMSDKPSGVMCRVGSPDTRRMYYDRQLIDVSEGVGRVVRDILSEL